MSTAAVAAVVTAAVLAAVGSALLPDPVRRLPEGDLFESTLPARWLLALVGAVAGGAVAWGLTAYGWGAGVFGLLPAYVYLVVVSVAMAFVDIALKRLPDVFTLRSYPIFFLLLVPGALIIAEPRRLLWALLGMAVIGGLYLLLALISPAGMGLGDVKLSGLLGLALGFLGVDPAFWGLLAGFLIGAIVSLVGLAVQRSRDLKQTFPYGPSMLAGTLLAIMFA